MKIIILLVGILFINFFAQASSAKEIGTVMIVRGQAALLRNEKNQKIVMAMQIFEGDQLETQADSYVKIVMKDRNILVVTEKSKLKIEEYKDNENNKKVSINLEYGSLRHKLDQKYKNKNEIYEVRTATSVAGVRGTDFLTEYNKESGDSVLCTLDGQVSFDVLKDGKAENNPVVASGGQFIRFKKGDARPQVIAVKQAWLDKALKLHSLD